jgi:hypothetical protein
MAVERKRGFAAEWRRLAYETWIARHWSLDQALQYSLDKTRLGCAQRIGAGRSILTYPSFALIYKPAVTAMR